jgi:hypothetical protein
MLDDDSVAPKQKILEVIEYMEEEQQRIAMIQAQAQMLQQRASQFLMGDEEQQSDMMADAMAQLEMEQDLQQAEGEVAQAEEKLPSDKELEK